MALFCQNMIEIAIELTVHKPTYADMAVKFVEPVMTPKGVTTPLACKSGTWNSLAPVVNKVRSKRTSAANFSGVFSRPLGERP